MNRPKYYKERKLQRRLRALKGWEIRKERMKERPLRASTKHSGAPCFEIVIKDLRTNYTKHVKLLSSAKRKNTFDVVSLTDNKQKRGLSATKIAARIREIISI